MNTVAVLFVLLVGGTLFGFLGLLLAIPATGIAAVVAHDVLEIYRHTDFWRGTSEDGPIALQLMRSPTYAPLGRELSLEHELVGPPEPKSAQADLDDGVAPPPEPPPEPGTSP